MIMKTLMKFINEGILDANLINKDPDQIELIKATFTNFYAQGMRERLSSYFDIVMELECAKYPRRIKEALKSIINELSQNKDIPAYKYIARELEELDSRIRKKFPKHKHIPDYSERVLKMVTAAHEVDSLLNKLSKKYSSGTTKDIELSLDVKENLIEFTISSSILGNIDKTIDAIENFKFSTGELDDYVHHEWNSDSKEEITIIIRIS